MTNIVSSTRYYNMQNVVSFPGTISLPVEISHSTPYNTSSLFVIEECLVEIYFSPGTQRVMDDEPKYYDDVHYEKSDALNIRRVALEEWSFINLRPYILVTGSTIASRELHFSRIKDDKNQRKR